MSRADLRIPGNVAVITGGGAGIGREIAGHLTKSGVDVVINDLDETALAATQTTLTDNAGEVTVRQGDVSEPDVASDLVETAVETYGDLDILVNNVGIAGPTAPIEDVTYDEFVRTLEVNLGAMFATTKAAVPHLRDRTGNRVINISSMSGKRPLRDRTPYTTSKMGVIGFTRTLAVELADDDVTVNALCPGSVNGERLETVIQGQAESQDQPYEDVEREFKEVSPMKQFVEAADVADTLLFLCSQRAKRMTGQDLNVTAGIVSY